MKPIFLAIETATSACSVALIQGEQLYSRFEIAPKAHTKLVLPMIESLLKEAQISLQEVNYIAVGRGPGSFTGVRLAVSVAQGLGFALNIPVYPVSTLDALAWQAKEQIVSHDNQGILAVLDARMQEIYYASYNVQADKLIAWHEESLCMPTALHADDFLVKDLVIVGADWTNEEINKTFSEWPQTNKIIQTFPNARHVGLIAQAQFQQGRVGMPADKVLPIYLRDKVAEKSAQIGVA